MNRKIQIIVLLMGCAAISSPLMAQRNSTDSLIKNLQTRVKIYPDDYAGFDNLGAAYLQKGRETGDAAYYELAKVALGKSLDLLSNDPAAVSAMTHMGVACMAEHRFGDALAWAQNAIALGSGDPSPWAIAGDALADMGDYARRRGRIFKVAEPTRFRGRKARYFLRAGKPHVFPSINRGRHSRRYPTHEQRLEHVDGDAHACRKYCVESIPAR